MDKDLAYALQMYGVMMVTYADNPEGAMNYENMVFWQNQAWMCAKAAAAKMEPRA